MSQFLQFAPESGQGPPCIQQGWQQTTDKRFPGGLLVFVKLSMPFSAHGFVRQKLTISARIGFHTCNSATASLS